MKKLLMVLMLSIISISTVFACHFYGGKKCKDKVYLHGSFSPNSIFEFRFYGADTTVIKRFSTGDRMGEIDSTITFDVPDSMTDIKISFRNHYLSDPLFNNWAGNYNAGDYYEVIDSTNSACGTLPITISGLGVIKKDDSHVQVTFLAESQANHYLVSASDSTEKIWIPIVTMKPNTSGKYDTGIISLVGNVSLGMGLLFITIIGFREKKRSHRLIITAISLGVSLIYIGCNKDKQTIKTSDFKIIKVEPISNTGQVIGTAAYKSF